MKNKVVKREKGRKLRDERLIEEIDSKGLDFLRQSKKEKKKYTKLGIIKKENREKLDIIAGLLEKI